MDTGTNAFSIDTRQLGYSPAGAVGNQSLAEVRQQIINSSQLLGLFQPQAITNSNIGAVSVNDPQILSVTPQKIVNGYVQGLLTVGPAQGSGGVLIDGQNKSIVVIDETGTPRVIIGYQANGF